MAAMGFPIETHHDGLNSSWQGQSGFSPTPPLGPKQKYHASPRRTSRASINRVRMFCPTCGFESFLPRSSDEARCLKCDTVLKGRSTQDRSNDGSVHSGHLQVHRLSGEVHTYEQLLLGEWESGHCHKSPNGAHHWKFGQCHYCHKAEGEIVRDPHTTHTSTDDVAWCAMGGMCDFHSASCRKCGRVRGLSCERRNSRYSVSSSPQPGSRRDSPSPQPSSRRDSFSSQSSSRRDSFSSQPSSRRDSPPPQPSSRQDASSQNQSFMLDSNPKRDTSGRFGRDCPKCGYRCYPWLNDEDRCLNCDEMLNRKPNDHEVAKGGSKSILASRAHDCPSMKSMSAKEASGSFQRSPNQIRQWNLDECKQVRKPERRSTCSSGGFSNPGGFLDRCTLGGKCVCKFGSCIKCGRAEGILSVGHMSDSAACLARRHSKPHQFEEDGCGSVPVGGSLQAVRKLQRSHCKVAADVVPNISKLQRSHHEEASEHEDEDQSTSAGSDDEESVRAHLSDECRICA